MDVLKGFNPNALYDKATDTEGDYDLGGNNESYVVVKSSEDDPSLSQRVKVMQPTYDLGNTSNQGAEYELLQSTKKSTAVSKNQTYDLACSTENTYDLASNTKATKKQPIYDLGRNSNPSTFLDDPDAVVGFYADTSGRAPGEYDVFPVKNKSRAQEETNYALASSSTENNYDLASNTKATKKQPIYDLGRNSNPRTLTSNPDDPDAAVGFYADTSGRAPGEYDVFPVKNKSRAPQETNYALASSSNQNTYDFASTRTSSSSHLRSLPNLPNRNLPPLDRTANKTGSLAKNTFVCDCCFKPFDPSFSPTVKSSSNPAYQGEDPSYEDVSSKSGHPTLTANSVKDSDMKDRKPYTTLPEYETLRETNVDDSRAQATYDLASKEKFGFNPYDLGEDSGQGDSSSDDTGSHNTESDPQASSSDTFSPSKSSISTDYTLVLPGCYEELKIQPDYTVPVKGQSVLKIPDDYELPAAHINTPELWAKKVLQSLPSDHPLRPLLLSYLSNPNFFNASLITHLAPEDLKHKNSLKNRAILISFCGDARHEECATESSGCTKQACQNITNVMKTVLRLEFAEEPSIVKVASSRSWKQIAKRIGLTVCGLGIATAVAVPVAFHFIGGGESSSSSPSNATSSSSSSDCTDPEFENAYQNVSQIATQTLGALALLPLADIACTMAAVAQAVFTGAAVLGLACQTKIQNNIQPLTNLPFTPANIEKIADTLDDAANSADCGPDVIAAQAASENAASSHQGSGMPPNFSVPPPGVASSSSQALASATPVPSGDPIAPSSSALPLPSSVASSSDSFSSSESISGQSSSSVLSSASIDSSSSDFPASSSIASSSQAPAQSSEASALFSSSASPVFSPPSPVSSASASSSQASSSPLASSASASASSVLPTPSPVSSASASSSLASSASASASSVLPTPSPVSSASASSSQNPSSSLSSSASASASSVLPTPSPVSSASASSSQNPSSSLSSSASASASPSSLIPNASSVSVRSSASPLVSSSPSARASSSLSQSLAAPSATPTVGTTPKTTTNDGCGLAGCK